MPLNQASVGAVSREQAADAAGLYNMARNLGGSIGLAGLGLFIDRRVESHYDSIASTVTANSDLVQAQVAGRAAALVARSGDVATAHQQALASICRARAPAGLRHHLLRVLLGAGRGADRHAAPRSPPPRPAQARRRPGRDGPLRPTMTKFSLVRAPHARRSPARPVACRLCRRAGLQGRAQRRRRRPARRRLSVARRQPRPPQPAARSGGWR